MLSDNKRILLFCLAAFLYMGCQRDKISVYKAPKEAASAAMPMMGMGSGASAPMDTNSQPPMGNDMSAPTSGGPIPQSGAMPSGNGQLPPGHPDVNGSKAGMMGGNMDMSAPSDAGVKWTAPKGWTAKPPSQMRVASFSAAGKNGQAVDISVVSLAGEAGGNLSNVNRWRGQIELAPISEDALAKVTKKISPAGMDMLLTDIVSDKPVIENKFKKRLVAAIYQRGGQSWFFKMVGEDSAVSENKSAFMKFLESLKFPQ